MYHGVKFNTCGSIAEELVEIYGSRQGNVADFFGLFGAMGSSLMKLAVSLHRGDNGVQLLRGTYPLKVWEGKKRSKFGVI